MTARALTMLLVLTLPAAAQSGSQSIPSEKLKLIKAASVFIKVRGSEGSGTGSGFVVRSDKDECWIVTNDHVVSLKEKPQDQSARNSVEIIFNSGLKEEWSHTAEVMAQDPVWDLAVLKVKTQKVFPTPLPIDVTIKLEETAPVYVCGFPFGGNIVGRAKNPEISIGQATVSSLRTDEKGELASVQLNGALNPGNSGGPVVTTDGKLAGVAVRSWVGLGIGEAVPVHRVKELMNGRFDGKAATIDDAPDQDKKKRTLRYKLLDPFRNLKDFTVVVAPAPPPTLIKAKNPADVSKEPGATTLTLVPNKNEPLWLEAVFTAPEHEHFVWHQVRWTDGDGKSHVGDAERIDTTVPVKKKKPANQGRNARLPNVLPKTMQGLLSLDETPLPEMAVRLPSRSSNKDEGFIDCGKLNIESGELIGKKVVVDVLVKGFNKDGDGDGPALVVFDDNNLTQPAFLDFVIDKTIQNAMMKFAKINSKAYPETPLAARIKATIGPAINNFWRLVVVEELGFLNSKGEAVLVMKRTEEHEYTGDRRRTSKPSLTQSDSQMKQLLKRVKDDADSMLFSTITLAGPAVGLETEAAEYPDTERKVTKLKLKDETGDPTFKMIQIYLTESMAQEFKQAMDMQKEWTKQPLIVTAQVVRHHAGKKQLILCATGIGVKGKDSTETHVSVKAEEGPRDVPRMVKPGDSVPDNLDPPAGAEPMPMTETPMPMKETKDPLAMVPGRKAEDEKPMETPMTTPTTAKTDSGTESPAAATTPTPVVTEPAPRTPAVVPAEKPMEKEKDMLPYIIVGAGVGLGGLGIAYAMMQSKKSAAPAKKARRREVEEYDDEDDDGEDRAAPKPRRR